MAIDKNNKFYMVVVLADFQNWILSNPNHYNQFRNLFLNNYDVTRVSLDGTLAIYENRLSENWSFGLITAFSNTVKNESWLIGIFPYYEPIPITYINQGWNKTILTYLQENDNLWNDNVLP